MFSVLFLKTPIEEIFFFEKSILMCTIYSANIMSLILGTMLQAIHKNKGVQKALKIYKEQIE